MSHHTKVSGVWRNAIPYTKVSGTWKMADYLYNKVGGRWYTSFVKGGLADRSWDDRDSQGEFGSGASGTVRSLSVGPGGNIFVGGEFITWNGVSANGLVRLNTNYSLDTSFATNIGTGTNGTVNTVAVQSDEKVIFGGFFDVWNGGTVGRIVRLNSNGTLDTSFMANIGSGANDGPRPIVIQSDGKILVGGQFTTWNGTTVGRIVRLNSDGTRDTTFTTNNGTGANGIIYSIAVQSDGKIVIGGGFTTWNGASANGIARLNSDGTIDSAFSTNIGLGADLSIVFNVAVATDGKIVAVGPFQTWAGVSVGGIVRLNSNGTRDTAFTANVGTGTTANVWVCHVRSDGKIFVSGDFATWSGTAVGRMVCLNSDGTRDTEFSTVGANGGVYAILFQADGKIILGGQFITWNGIATFRIVRLNDNGTFTLTTNGFANGNVLAIAIQPDGKIILGGSFTTWNGTTVGRVVRLNADGTLDTTFTTNNGTGANQPISANSIAIQSDGKILVGGAFNTWNGTTVGRIVRLNSDGTLDTTFTTNNGTGANGNVLAIAIQSDGKIVVGGLFTQWNAVTVNRIVRLNTDGTRETAFNTNTNFGPNGTVLSIVIQPDGKILIGGAFATWNAVTVNRIVRLNSNGTRETAFNTNLGSGFPTDVNRIVLQPDGKILVCGAFTSVSGTSTFRLIRLNSNGSRDTAFIANTGSGAGATINSMDIQSDGKILIGGLFVNWNGTAPGRIVRLNSDGTTDNDFRLNTLSGANSNVQVIAVQPDKKILVGGAFTSYRTPSRINRYFVRIGGENAS